MKRRLYIVVRGDLDPGLQAAQACHAARAYPAPPSEDENLVVLAARSSHHLGELFELGRRMGPSVAFHEPDLDGALTAIALGGDLESDAGKVSLLLSQLPRALRPPRPEPRAA